ncbi:hypothetical protein B0J17DRAFT_156952 [Rhizoctonia solani]|nr:hypothetical protein B0J17DRAFT_156952 [Rhizoctonia solani]
MPPDAPPPPKRLKLTTATKETAATPSTTSNSAPVGQPQVSHTVTVRSGTPGTRDAKKATIWTGLETALQGLRISARSFLPLRSTVGALTTRLELFEQASIHQGEYEALAMELEAVVNFLQQHLRIARSSRILGVMSSVSRAIDKEVKLICEIRDGSLSRRIAHASKDEEVLVRVYCIVTELFSRLQIEIGMDAWSIANEHLVNT